MKNSIGPVSSAVAAAHTLRWKHQRDGVWLTAGGLQIDLATASPDTVRRLAERDATAEAWRRAAASHEHLAHLDDPPFLEVLQRLVGPKSVLDRRQRGLLKGFSAGAFFRFSVCRCGAAFNSATRCWAHFAWECDITAEFREGLCFPLHSLAAATYEGVPADFVTKIRRFVDTPWVQTGILPDPRATDPPPANPEIVRWKVPAGVEPLFAGDCGGDGSCNVGGRRPPPHARAGWAVVEVYRHYPSRRLTAGKSAAGTLPGWTQSAEGAELYAILFWLRHLDPASPSKPRFFLRLPAGGRRMARQMDCGRVVGAPPRYMADAGSGSGRCAGRCGGDLVPRPFQAARGAWHGH